MGKSNNRHQIDQFDIIKIQVSECLFVFRSRYFRIVLLFTDKTEDLTKFHLSISKFMTVKRFREHNSPH